MMALTVLFSWDGGWFGLCIGALIIGAIAGFFVARWFFQKQIKDNPPINEKMIRAMFMQMGRKPSEAQIRAVMNSMKNQK
ncbi:MAG: YneF family protein [Bacillota bacterium]|nr:YneF family protein [Bacillota bacterium]